MKDASQIPQAYNGGRGRMRTRSQRGVTLLEMIVASAILLTLMSVAFPVARFTIKRQKESELRRDLWEMRAAIDRYKAYADNGRFQVKVGTDGYPEDLDTMVKGIDIAGKKVRFLRRIPVDPITGKAEWGMRSEQDDPKSESWGEQNVFDVYSKSEGTALDGTKYKDW